MKYLKKYNESVNLQKVDYIKNCFIDLIDSGAKIRKVVVRENNDGGYICSVSIELPMPTFEGDAMSVKEFIDYNEIK
jgi:hypothetical protein